MSLWKDIKIQRVIQVSQREANKSETFIEPFHIFLISTNSGKHDHLTHGVLKR